MAWHFLIQSFAIFCLTGSALGRSIGLPEAETSVDYTGYKVIRVHSETKRQRELFRTFYEEGMDGGVTLWTEPLRANQWMDFLVAGTSLDDFMKMIHKEKFTYEVLINDLQGLIDTQKIESEEYKRSSAEKRKRRRRSLPVEVNAGNDSDVISLLGIFDSEINDEGSERDNDLDDITNRYATYREICDWLWLLNRRHPNITRVLEIGTSYNGRTLLLIKIGEPRQHSPKPAIWIDGGIHAREWISPATAVFVINSLIEGYGKEEVITNLLRDFDWYILPVMNPDGYEYSHTTDRLWRKTRSRVMGYRRNCVGVDANRNFDFHWQSECENNPRCRGRMPCNDVFAGHRPFSEPETIAVANFLLQYKHHFKMYLSFHSYSQLWLLPWAYTKKHPEDYPQLLRLSEQAVDALKVPYNTTYSVGTPAEILYLASGGSYDWAKGVAGIKYSFTVELRDTGSYGFLLPQQQIQPTGRETWAAIKESVKELKLDTCWISGTNCSRPTTRNRRMRARLLN